jgi:hypothetical protein
MDRIVGSRSPLQESVVDIVSLVKQLGVRVEIDFPFQLFLFRRGLSDGFTRTAGGLRMPLHSAKHAGEGFLVVLKGIEGGSKSFVDTLNCYVEGVYDFLERSYHESFTIGVNVMVETQVFENCIGDGNFRGEHEERTNRVGGITDQYANRNAVSDAFDYLGLRVMVMRNFNRPLLCLFESVHGKRVGASRIPLDYDLRVVGDREITPFQAGMTQCPVCRRVFEKERGNFKPCLEEKSDMVSIRAHATEKIAPVQYRIMTYMMTFWLIKEDEINRFLRSHRNPDFDGLRTGMRIPARGI